MKEELVRAHKERKSKAVLAAHVAVFSSLSVIGSFLRLPSPIQSVAFDSAPGFFAALYFGALEGGLVTGIGHIITAIINGLPLGVLHLPVALGMGCAGGAMGLINRARVRFGLPLAILAGVSTNAALFLLVVPILGWVPALAFLPFLLTAAVLNALAAAMAYIETRRRLVLG